MKHRHRARRLALQGLCCLDVQGPDARPQVGAFIDDSEESEEARRYATAMLDRVMADRDACDAILVRHAKRWDLRRLALVDRNILRLAVAELEQRQTPFKVVLAEAIRLAQEFSSSESSRFVNGVLDAVARELHAGDDAVAADDDPLDDASLGEVPQDQ